MVTWRLLNSWWPSASFGISKVLRLYDFSIQQYQSDYRHIGGRAGLLNVGTFNL